MKNSFLIISSFILFLSSCVKDQLPEVLPSVISGTPTFEDKTIGWQNGQFINNTILVVTGEVLSNGETQNEVVFGQIIHYRLDQIIFYLI